MEETLVGIQEMLKPTDEEEFVFDPETQTITEYKGEKTSVVVPAKIKGVPVKRIGNEAFKGDGKDADKAAPYCSNF